ncbi:19558_t:CDS:2, partial [Funneliformis geosporum]
YLFLSVESFTPAGRQSHSSVLVENKIYFFGGVMDDGNCTNEVFYLDWSKQFNSEFPSWTDLTLNSGLDFKSCWATAVLNDDTIYLIGGIMDDQNNDDSFVSLLYAFNPKSGQWNTPAIQGNKPERRRNVQAIADDTRNIYVFGGKTDENLGSKIVQFFNDMLILNVNDLTWSYGPIANVPLKRDLYTASLLSDGRIVYIGGREQYADNTQHEKFPIYNEN